MGLPFRIWSRPESEVGRAVRVSGRPERDACCGWSIHPRTIETRRCGGLGGLGRKIRVSQGPLKHSRVSPVRRRASYEAEAGRAGIEAVAANRPGRAEAIALPPRPDTRSIEETSLFLSPTVERGTRSSWNENCRPWYPRLYVHGSSTGVLPIESVLA